MLNQRLFDQVAAGLHRGDVAGSAGILIDVLTGTHLRPHDFAAMQSDLFAHPLHDMLLEDPFTRRAWAARAAHTLDPRLIDLLCDGDLPPDASPLGAALFAAVADRTATMLRARRDVGANLLAEACAAGQRVCVLQCGHLREADALIGTDLGNIVGVDRDADALDLVWRTHQQGLNLVQADPIAFLQTAARDGRMFGVIYSINLVDFLGDADFHRLCGLIARCLEPGGRAVLVVTVPDHPAVGWLDGVADWTLTCRDEATLATFARAAGLSVSVTRDAVGGIIRCEMTR